MSLRIIFIYGNDEFAITRRLKKLQQRVDKDGMNTSRLEARTMGKDELNMAVNAMPFLADRRLVLLENPSSKYKHPKHRKDFLAFLETVPPTTVLALYEEMDEKKATKHWLVKWANANKEIARAEAESAGLSVESCLAYLRNNLHFYLGPLEQRGLELFRRQVIELDTVAT